MEQLSVNLDKINHSELVALVQWIGVPASRAVPREVLIEALKSLQPFSFYDPVEEKRQHLSEFLKRYWKKIQMQATKKACPNCHLCRDAQVLECFTLNKQNLGVR